MSKDVTRLYRQFQPEHYRLHIEPNAQDMTFKGHVVITGLKVGRPSQRLTLHQKDLKIISCKLSKQIGKEDQVIEVDRINRHQAYDEVRLHAKDMIYPGKYTIELEFSGQITKPMNGLYPCFFEDNGQSNKLLATQFESHHAREVFPCIDEPEAKATFELSLVTPAGQTVIANTAVKKQTKTSGNTTTIFQTTPKMSVYLLAFVVGDLGFEEAKTVSGVTVRAYATPQNAKLTKFALDVAVKCLDFYNEYFGLPYPLEKCDLVALPDFASGAMENWGCITFREHVMLVDEKNTSLAIKQYVAMVVAHELAHQWFGNLVTMRWWTDLWLNEGFASWIEYLAVDHMFPDWQMWTQFAVDEQQSALRLDALQNTHPIEVPVHHPDEIRTIFDAISYNKGASVIHMLQAYLGATDFRNGLRIYLKKHKYGNTDTVDLWDALSEASGKPVRQFMHNWTSSPGFPLLSVSQKNNRLFLKQSRFYANPKQVRDQKACWPIALQTSGQLKSQILTKKQQDWAIGRKSEITKFNQGQTGFFRVNYVPELLGRLTQKLQSMPAVDRLGLLSDAFESAKAGYTPTTSVLSLLQNYAAEDDNAVWDVMAGVLSNLRMIMDNEELRELMKPFTTRLVRQQLQRLGWKVMKNESHFDGLLRPTIIGLAALSDEPATVKECLKLFKTMKQPSDLPPDLRGVIYNTAARHGDQQTFDKLLRLHNDSISSEERTTLASAICSFKQPQLFNKALAAIKTKDVRLQDAAYWVAYSFMNRHSKQAAWIWLTKNWDWLLDNLGADLSFSRFPIYAARSFSNSKFRASYQEFFEARMTPAIERAYLQGLETIDWQADWRKRDLANVLTFFKAHQDTPSD